MDATATAVDLRWMIRRDLPDVLAIEESSFLFPWREEDFLAHLRQRNCLGFVAERDGQIVGFMVYELHRTHLRLLNIAVAWEARGQSVGSQMIGRLIDKVTGSGRRDRIDVEVPETNLGAQLFFRAAGFVAARILREWCEVLSEDAYLMVYRRGWP